MKRSLKQYFIIILLGILLSSCGEDRESIVVERADLVEAVYSSVVIEPKDLYTVKASLSGYLDEIFIEEGAIVERGNPLFWIRDVVGSSSERNAQLAFEQAKKNYSGSRSILEEIRLEVNQLALKRKNDSINLSRNESLYQSGAVTKLTLEQSDLAFQSSKTAHLASVNRLRRTEQDAKTLMEQAQNNYISSSSRSSDSRITASISGKVYNILKERGDFISIQEPIAILGSEKEFTINLLVDEVDINRISIGQQIYVNLESYPGKLFKAKVDRIIPQLDQQTQTFKVIGSFSEKPRTLYMGLTGEASIVVDERKKALVIPLEYLSPTDEVETDEGLLKVKTGIRSLSHVEITGNLKEGTRIYKPAL